MRQLALSPDWSEPRPLTVALPHLQSINVDFALRLIDELGFEATLLQRHQRAEANRLAEPATQEMTATLVQQIAERMRERQRG